MKEVLTSRMESMVITMNSLQQKYSSVKLQALSDWMELTESATLVALNALRKKDLVVKLGRGKDSSYQITKLAQECLTNKTLVKVIKGEYVKRQTLKPKITKLPVSKPIKETISMKYKKKVAKLEARIKNWEMNLARKLGFKKPGSIK